MTTNRTIITNPELLKEHHPDAIRMVVHDDGESWRCYLILDRKKVCEGLRRVRAQTSRRRWYIYPEWHAHYGGPGREYAHKPFRVAKQSRRFVVYGQTGGLDI
jgi:hypothetical protein